MQRNAPGRRDLGAAARFKSAEKRLKTLQKQLDKFDKEHVVKMSDDCVGAFVVFNCEDSKRFCLEDYNGSNNWWSRMFQVRVTEIATVFC